MDCAMVGRLADSRTTSRDFPISLRALRLKARRSSCTETQSQRERRPRWPRSPDFAHELRAQSGLNDPAHFEQPCFCQGATESFDRGAVGS